MPNTDKLTAPYWLCLILELIIFILTLIIIFFEVDLFFDSIGLHLLICAILGIISAGLQVIIFEDKSYLILFKKENCLLNFGVKIVLFVILIYSSLFYIFNNPLFIDNYVITGLYFWVFNIFSLELFDYKNKKILNQENYQVPFNFSKQETILFTILMIATCLMYVCTGLKSKNIINQKTLELDGIHIISALFVGMLASIYFMYAKRIFVSKIKDNKLEWYFLFWLIMFLFLLGYCRAWVSAFFIFILLSLVYVILLYIICCVFKPAQIRIVSEAICSSIVIFVLFYLCGGLTLVTLQYYPNDTFAKISITNFCFWITNIFTPILYNIKVQKNAQKNRP